MRTVFIIYLLVSLLHFVLCCEEDETHYKNKSGECCKKCGPGKRMLVDDNCKDPRCQDCKIGEYQSGYTSNTRCERQPSCDTNLHLKPQEDKPITNRLNKCVCEPGYYCTLDDDCSACMKHSVCKPGQRVAKKGSPESDTVCETCKNGTFSDHDSADTCEEWTTCDYGYDQNTPGSSTSDRSCLGSPVYRAVTGVGIAVLVLVVIIVLVVYFYMSKRNQGWKEVKGFAADQMVTPLNIRPVHREEDVERADQPTNRQPQEDLDHSEPVSPSPSNMTENGNVVDQEHGKEHIISSTESNGYSYSYS
ncbi:tumor necrosis factor receptor superfamily member 5 [Rhinichthys klamathensis goyatoka]|uniref:tumor necrosis factor receptor superfamily member 5 n=1 Tax=Rhinichthys klamathensis goyatoka TaxID=3034132 RepID=UPI0024B5CC02|nr:tumor necrosis factor receptor superfamily member 5 [Rhinichthys klamathensis goyatoka]